MKTLRLTLALALCLGVLTPGEGAAKPDPGLLGHIAEGVNRSVRATHRFISGAPAPSLGGRLEATIKGRVTPFPALSTDIDVQVSGDLATVSITQTFTNPTQTPLDVTYAFPMNSRAAVYGLEMELNGRVIEGVIKEKAQARETFETAKAEGKNAALLVQHRPNVFTQEVSNLMPGSPIQVTIHYTQAVPRIDGSYELVIPTVVGPRFTPPAALNQADSAALPEGAWSSNLPDSFDFERANLPKHIDGERLSLDITLEPGLPLTYVESPSHDLWVRDGEHITEITLDKGRAIDNRDFVLRYTLAGATVQTGIMSHKDERGAFFSILLEPPADVPEEGIQPREMVFVLDCSGSMHGHPLTASKAFMEAALRSLRPTDTFRIIRFSESAGEMNQTPLPATPANIRRGIAYTQDLNSQGGTYMTAGIHQALSVPIPEGSLRLVTFLTDGYIGNDGEVLALLKEEVGDARMFAIGVGTATNRFLLNKMGELGRGFTRYIDPTMNPESSAVDLANLLQTPVLTDITIDWGALESAEIYPRRPRDLFLGDSLRIQGRAEQGGTFPITIRGQLRGQPATLPITLKIEGESHDAIPLIWARSAIETAETERLSALRAPQNEAIIQRITQLGLDYSLMTAFTSFVAVSQEVVKPQDEQSLSAQVPLPQVAGTSGMGGGFVNTGFSGSSTPEPGTLLGLMMAGGAALAGLRRKREGE